MYSSTKERHEKFLAEQQRYFHAAKLSLEQKKTQSYFQEVLILIFSGELSESYPKHFSKKEHGLNNI